MEKDETTKEVNRLESSTNVGYWEDLLKTAKKDNATDRFIARFIVKRVAEALDLSQEHERKAELSSENVGNWLEIYCIPSNDPSGEIRDKSQGLFEIDAKDLFKFYQRYSHPSKEAVDAGSTWSDFSEEKKKRLLDELQNAPMFVVPSIDAGVIKLLGVARCPNSNCDGTGRIKPHGEQCQWCDEKSKLLSEFKESNEQEK